MAWKLALWPLLTKAADVALTWLHVRKKREKLALKDELDKRRQKKNEKVQAEHKKIRDCPVDYTNRRWGRGVRNKGDSSDADDASGS